MFDNGCGWNGLIWIVLALAVLGIFRCGNGEGCQQNGSSGCGGCGGCGGCR